MSLILSFTPRRLFAERRQLNADVLNSLQPQLFDGAATVDGQDPAPALLAIMDKLSSNLREEQRSLAELDYTMFTKLLTPIQVPYTLLVSPVTSFINQGYKPVRC